MASASDGRGSGHERTADSRLASEFVARLADGELLDRIIDETALAESGEDGAEELRLLRQVAARYRGATFDLEPVAIEMVRAVVGSSYRNQLANEEAWQAMTRGIAQTLFDDPRSRPRLESLWRRLQEADK